MLVTFETCKVFLVKLHSVLQLVTNHNISFLLVKRMGNKNVNKNLGGNKQTVHTWKLYENNKYDPSPYSDFNEYQNAF